jgi:hypothetical protein
MINYNRKNNNKIAKFTPPLAAMAEESMLKIKSSAAI